MLFFLGLIVGATVGVFFSALAVAASRDASARDGQEFLRGLEHAPLIPTDLEASSVNTGRYEIINEAALSRPRMDLKTGTED